MKKRESTKIVSKVGETEKTVTKNAQEELKSQMRSSANIGKETPIKLKIRFGGNMSQNDKEYEYVGEIGKESVLWKVGEIRWKKFEDYVKSECIAAPVGLIWYKKVSEDMKALKYVYDNTDYDMAELIRAGKEDGEVDVWIEHEVSEHLRGKTGVYYLPSSQVEDFVHEGREAEEDDDNFEDDRPKEDDEPEESEDEKELENEEDDGNEVDNEAGNEADNEDDNAKDVFF